MYLYIYMLNIKVWLRGLSRLWLLCSTLCCRRHYLDNIKYPSTSRIKKKSQSWQTTIFFSNFLIQGKFLCHNSHTRLAWIWTKDQSELHTQWNPGTEICFISSVQPLAAWGIVIILTGGHMAGRKILSAPKFIP